MPRHTFVQHTKLRDVSGRIDYTQNPKRQEHLYAAYNTAPPEYWSLLAKQNRLDFERSGTSGACVEARELIIALPACLRAKDPVALLKLFTDAFKEKYGVECVSALHHNKTKTNYHIHLIFSERKLKDKVEKKVAGRNTFYDETGRHVRTKKEILDSDGKIRPGCHIVPKGTVYEINGFDPKEKLFKQKTFTDEVRGFYTGLINQLVPENEQLTVFPRGGPFLATQKIGKNNPKAEKIRKINEVRQEWNAAVSDAMARGVPTEDLRQMKSDLVSKPVTQSVKKFGHNPVHFTRILRRAISLLIEKTHNFKPGLLATLARLQEETDRRNQLRKERVLMERTLKPKPKKRDSIYR